MKNLIVVLAIVACTFVHVGCGKDNTILATPNCDCELGDTLIVDLGDTYTISLLAAYTAGYKWEYEKGFDERYVELESYSLEAVDPDDDREGVPLYQKWTYRAREKGTICATLIYTRAWEDEPLETKDVLVIIE